MTPARQCAGQGCERLIVPKHRTQHGAYPHRGRGLCAACYHRAARQLSVDEIAIERAVNGNPPGRLTTRERAAAVSALHARGLSAAEIARRVGCTKRTVVRYRARLRAAGVAA